MLTLGGVLFVASTLGSRRNASKKHEVEFHSFKVVKML